MVDHSADFSGIKPVSSIFAFDELRLHDWMVKYIEGYEGPLKVLQFKGGQSNPTYKIKTKKRDYVLRRKPPGALLPSAHAVEREYRVMTALYQTGFPVPEMYGLCEDVSILGTAFYVMSFVEGRIFWDPAIPSVTVSERHALYDSANETLAKLHNIDYVSCGLGDFGKVGNYFHRQISRWSNQYIASQTDPINEMERLIEWLPASAPVQGQTSIVHGDYRFDNLVFDNSNAKVVAVLDWELSTLGDPLADFTYQLMQWKMPASMQNGIDGIDLSSLGIPSLEGYVEAYCLRTNRREFPDLNFYLAYNAFRLAAILQGVFARAIKGNASNSKGLEMGGLVHPMARLAWKFALLAGA